MNIEILEQTRLFYGIERENIKSILECNGARYAEYEKNQTVIRQGDINTDIGIVLSGCGRSVIGDASGKTLIMAVLEKGSYIGLLLAASRDRKSPVTIQALTELAVLFLPFDRMISQCACPQHDVLLRNCFESLSEKSLALYDRIECLIRPTVREKVMTYLHKLAEENESNVFMIPFDRNAMAEYINVDRSALSRELSRMKTDGLIDYYKNSFKLL